MAGFCVKAVSARPANQSASRARQRHYLRTVRAGDRATEFRQRCDGLEILGVSLHSYRYAWAERALKCGYGARYPLWSTA